jgi:glycosyltransferase involved in cell wall biosynthesis
MTPKLSIISHFYNHPLKVERQLAHWAKAPADYLKFTEFVLVDDCSEDRPTIEKSILDLRLFRVISDVPWNQGGARNLAAFHARGEWGLFFDIDQELNLDTLPLLLANLDRLDPTTMYYLRIKELINVQNGEHLHNHPNTFLVNMTAFREWGMYDEDFSGHYGYEDLYMPRVWDKNGGRRAFLGDQVFFEDLGFGTQNFTRDLDRNKALAMTKLSEGCRNSPGMLRFRWEAVPL